MDTMYISVDESQMSVFFLDCFRFCMNDIEYDIILNKMDLIHMNMKYGSEPTEKCLWSQ